MKKALIIIGGFAVLGILVGLNLMKKDNGPEVTVQKITRGTVIKKVTGSGRIKPAVEVKISANVSGKILHINAKEGDFVKKDSSWSSWIRNNMWLPYKGPKAPCSPLWPTRKNPKMKWRALNNCMIKSWFRMRIMKRPKPTWRR